jgi:hypothetical protein
MPSNLIRLMILLAAIGPAAAARAGGGPENLFLVVNSASADSLAVANAFAELRGVPPINVLMLPWKNGDESTSIAAFRTELLGPILRAIDARKLSAQIDCIVYSADFPWRIDFKDELPRELAGKDKFPSGSLTGMTMLYGTVLRGGVGYLDPGSNRYWRPLDDKGVPATTAGFRGWHGWGLQGELMEAGGERYLLAVMLGVTAGRGNTVPEVVRYLAAAAAADGSRPTGTVYFVTNGDVRTTTRSGAFAAAVAELRSLGVAGEVVAGTLPVGKRDVAGLMCGSSEFDWRKSGSTILPGAICENLTSYGGIFTPPSRFTTPAARPWRRRSTNRCVPRTSCSSSAIPSAVPGPRSPPSRPSWRPNPGCSRRAPNSPDRSRSSRGRGFRVEARPTVSNCSSTASGWASAAAVGDSRSTPRSSPTATMN